ncbi:RDD family protein [Pigmentiphaga litoralis]|uniref:RDD family protein n=1 Tax=Pigmentiphaga litoralis TaxID=516702 RepID=UPI003B429EBE
MSPATRQAAYAAAPTPGKWTRFACMMYEAILLFGVVFVADYLFDTLTQSKHALALRHERQAWLFVAIGAYFILCWRMGGQTLPMKTWDIRLVDGNGGRIPLWKAVVRYVLSWPVTFSGIGYVWACFDKDRQFLHDRLVGTRLIVSKAVKRPRSKG